MDKIEIKYNWIKIGASFVIIVSILTILFTLSSTPGRVVRNLSAYRIEAIIVGIVGLSFSLLFINKPYLFNALINNSALRNNYFLIIISIFSILTFLKGLPPTIFSAIQWRNEISNHDADALRIKFHYWYKQEHTIWEFIRDNIPYDEPVLIDDKNCGRGFFAYYLAPRPIYIYSDAFANELQTAGCKYHVLTTTCKNEIVTEWSIKEGIPIKPPSSCKKMKYNKT